MIRSYFDSMPEFLMDIRRNLWLRLAEFTSIEIITEAERIEERPLAQEFCDWQPVEYRLRPDIK